MDILTKTFQLYGRIGKLYRRKVPAPVRFAVFYASLPFQILVMLPFALAAYLVASLLLSIIEAWEDFE